MSAQYKGMRWLKCDLQVQTPEDSRHWIDDDLQLGDPRRPKTGGVSDETNLQEKARIFLRRCHELELDLIGITDHNFSAKSDPRDWFAVHMIEQNKSVAREFDRDPLIIIPGFEVDIGYHLLCLFAPAKKQRDFERCNKILTKLGLPEDARFDQSGPKQLRQNDQRLSLKKLLEIVQNEHEGIVIAAHADQNRGIFVDSANRDDYANELLYCVELTQNPPAEKYKNILSGKDGTWCRKNFHPAWIMSSDAKSLKSEDEKPIANSLGYRYTWIRMSKPSVESLRQAFLDQESRILLPRDTTNDVHPDQRMRQPRVLSISIKNVAFLGDQEVNFSPNMNCVIGGRGSGKSTLLEYLRIIFGKDKSEGIDEDTESRINRIKGTLNSDGAEIEVSWVSADGAEDRIVWKNGEPSVQREDDLYDPETFFQNLPIRFFSQQQLNRLTESQTEDGGQTPQAQRLLDLIDGFATNELSDLDDLERKLKLKIQASFSNLRRANGLEKDLKKSQQEYQELDRQWQARSEIKADAIRHQKLKEESRYLDTLHGEPGRQFTDVAELADAVASSHTSFQVDDSPHGPWLRRFDAKVKRAKEDLAKHIRQTIEQYQQGVESLKAEDPTWATIQQELDQADAKFSQACAAKGLTPDDVGHLKEVDQARAKKQREITELQAEIKRLKDEAGDSEALVKQLHQLWQDQFKKRLEAASRANERAVLTEDKRKFIEVTVQYQFDQASFTDLWNHFAPQDGRGRLARSWKEIGQELMSRFRQVPQSASPWELLRNLYHESSGEGARELFQEHADSLKKHIVDNIESWDQLRLSRVKDSVDLELFRPDGTVAGSISKDSLSDGQRNTAALALLLAQNGGPLVIDQPEDELDSNFVFKELIPMLRKVKAGRQIILATHNANLPVNGDAELVYALEAKDGKGVIRAQGGLDQSDVTAAVLDIMEGTEEAFRRRREKYHF